MLVFNEERLVPTDINVMVFSGKDESGYFYVHRSLYDQAVIINDIYKDNIRGLYELLGGEGGIRDDVEFFMSKTPEPIRILGPFLLLVKEPIERFIDMVGAIHVMATQCDLRNMLRVPKEIRASLKYSLHITEEYQLSWDRFLVSSVPYMKPVLVSAYAQMPERVDSEEVPTPASVIPEEDEGEYIQMMRMLGAPQEEIDAVKNGDVKFVELESNAEAVDDMPAVSDTLPEPKEPKKQLRGLDIVRSFL